MLVPKRSAVLFIDFQVDVCAEGGAMVSQTPEVLDRFLSARQEAKRLLEAARGANDPFVVHVQHVFEEGYPELDGMAHVPGMFGYVRKQGAFLADSSGAEIVPELAPAPGETVLRKTSISAFATTDLDVRLRRRHIDTVVIAGVVTHYAVLGTAMAAADQGYHVIVPRTTCTSGSEETHHTALSILGPLTTVADLDEVLAELSRQS
jgi:nicotinamidase-related amidase